VSSETARHRVEDTFGSTSAINVTASGGGGVTFNFDSGLSNPRFKRNDVGD